MLLLIEKLITSVIRNRKIYAVIAVTVFTASLLTALFSAYTNELHHLFPASGETGKSFQVLNKSHLADTVQLEFICDGNGKVTDYENYLDQCAGKLAKIPSIRQVTFRYRSKSLEIPDFSAAVTTSQDPAILDQCDPAKAVKDAQRQLALPMSDVKSLRKRPYPVLERTTVENLTRLNEYGGMQLAPDLPYFANREKNRAMIVFETDIAIGDADAVRQLYGEVDKALSPAPEGISYRIISGCNHTLGNESVLKRDATIAGIISVLLFLILFLFFYRRDFRALWIPVLPMIAAVPALGITALSFDEVCFYVIGLGSCIAGLAVDQGIHVYSVCQSPGSKVRNSAALAQPLLLSSGTTILVFLFLAFTGIEAYMQLALFAGASLLISSLLALFMLPALLPENSGNIPAAETAGTAGKKISGKYSFAAVTAVILLFAAAVWGIGKLDFDLSADSLDGTPSEIIAAEKDFNAAWRDSNTATAMIAVVGENRESALQKLETIASELKNSGVPVAMPPIPSEKRRQEMQEKWRSPETLEALNELEKRTRTELKKQNMPEKFFDPFFTSMRSNQGEVPEFFHYIDQKMVKVRPESCTALAMIPETTANITAAREAARNIPDAAVISKVSFSDQLKRDFGSRFLILLACSIGGALLMALAVFRRIKYLILAALPVMFAFAVLIVLSVMFSFKINAAAGFALILLAGLAIDYGVYSVHLLENPEKTSIRRSLFLAAATTVAGSGALIFSRHPVLFGTGIVLSCGVAAASFCGLYLIPKIAGTSFSKNGKFFLFLPLMLILCSCSSTGMPLKNSPYQDAVRKSTSICAQQGRCKVRANARWEIFGNEFSAFLLFEIDHDSGTVTASGVTPAGTRLFLASGEKFELGTGIPENAAYVFSNIRQDLLHIFILDTAGAEFCGDPGNLRMKTPDGVIWQLQKSDFSRQQGTFPGRKWSCRYENNFETVCYKNFDKYYTIRLSGIKLVTGGRKK